MGCKWKTDLYLAYSLIVAPQLIQHTVDDAHNERECNGPKPTVDHKTINPILSKKYDGRIDDDEKDTQSENGKRQSNDD